MSKKLTSTFVDTIKSKKTNSTKDLQKESKSEYLRVDTNQSLGQGIFSSSVTNSLTIKEDNKRRSLDRRATVNIS